MSQFAQTFGRLPDMYTLVSVSTKQRDGQTESERQRQFEALFRDHVAGVASYCRWRSPSVGEAEDADAEVFLVAWRRLEDVPAGEAARLWFYATARRVIANQARSATRRSRLQEKLYAQPEATLAEHDPSGGLARSALEVLDPHDREVLLLVDWEGLTPVEIARIMRRPAVTVRGRLHRARRRFRAAFESLQAEIPLDPGRVPPIPDSCER